MPASGRSDRMGEEKLWAELGGQPLIRVTLDSVRRAELFDQVVVVAPRARWRELADVARSAGLGGVRLVEGGARRQDSVRSGVEICRDVTLVCVHDGARPLCPPRVFRDVVAAAREHGAATAAIASVDTIKRVTDGVVVTTVDRSSLVATQTPQAFERGVLAAAHARALTEGFQADDDCALVEWAGHAVRVVEGDLRNFKVTHPLDLTMARTLLGLMAPDAG